MVEAAVGVMVLTLKFPPIVTTVPDSLSRESPIELALVNLAMRPTVPPGLLTPLAAVKQVDALAVVQTS